MKFRAFAFAPGMDTIERGVYVEAASRAEATTIIRTTVAAIYRSNIGDVDMYNLDDEIENPEGVLNFVTGWRGETPCCWDEDPLILYRSATAVEAMQLWARLMNEANSK